MPSFLLIQWGIVGFFVGIHFLLGFFRGAAKSTYYTIVSVIMTVVTLFIISNISLAMILGGSITLASLFDLTQSITGISIPSQLIEYINNPAIASAFVMVVDLIMRIMAFFLLYPVIKWLLTVSIFRNIWKKGFKEMVLEKQNKKRMIKYEQKKNSKKFVPKRKISNGIISRIFGGLMGSLRGGIVAFVFLVPVLVIASFVSQVSNQMPTAINNEQELGTTVATRNDSSQPFIQIPNNVQEILNNIEEMNQSGLSKISRQIVINDKTLDRFIFDFVFTVKLADTSQQIKEINYGVELESIFGIATVLLEGGYLEEGYDFKTISNENLDDIEQVFTYISNSNLLGYMIPVATEFGITNMMPEAIDVDSQNVTAALNTIDQIDWTTEFIDIYALIEAALEFGTVEELIAYVNNPESLLNLTPEEATKFMNILRAYGNLEVNRVLNAGVAYAITTDQVKSRITWMPAEDVDQYLNDRMSFILDNPDFFIGEEGEIARLADLIEAFYSDEYGDVDLELLINGQQRPETFLLNQDSRWVSLLIEKLVEMELLIEIIPLGIDYGLYNAMGDQIERELADDIIEALSDAEWDNEIINVSDIYAELAKMGLNTLINNDASYYEFIDQIIVEHRDSSRIVIEKIFEDSIIVNTAIQIASPIIIDKFVTNTELKDIISDALISDPISGEVDFDFGKEVNSLLTIVEAIHQFSTLEELSAFGSKDLNQKIELFSNFGALSQPEFAKLEDAVSELQILDRMGLDALTYVKNNLGVPVLYVPQELDLGHDIAAILGLLYYAAEYTYDNKLRYPSYEEIDFAPLLESQSFRSYLLATQDNNHSSLLFSSIAYNIHRFSENEKISKYISIPDVLIDQDFEGVLWETEVNAFLAAILDFGVSFDDPNVMILSARGIVEATSNTSTINMNLLTQYENLEKANSAFASFDASKIVRSSLVTTINSVGRATTNLIGEPLKVPDIALDGEMMKEGMFIEFIHGLAVVADDMFETIGIETLADIQVIEGFDPYLEAYSQLEDTSIDKFSNITITRGMINDVLLSEGMQSYLVDTVNNAQNIFSVDPDFFALDDLLLDEEGAIKVEEINNLLVAIRSLGLTSNDEFKTLGPNTFANLIGENIDLNTNEDDLDRVLNSGVLYIFLDKILQLDSIGNFIGDTLNTSLGTNITDFDLTAPQVMLGNVVDNEEIEINRIPKEEFRRLVSSIDILGDVNQMSLETFSGLVNPDLPQDDFTTFIASDYIYIILGRLFEDSAFGDYVSNLLGGAFGDTPINLRMSTPLDAKGINGSIEEGLMTRFELRQLMISFKMLGFDGGADVDIVTIMNMIDANVDPNTGEDDFNRFLSSKYLNDKISQLVLSQSVIELIATNRFTYNEFVLPSSALLFDGEYDRLTNQELYDLFAGLNLLGLSDFDNVDIGINTVTSLTQAQVDDLLSSTYLYVTVDLMVQSEETLDIPPAALEDIGEYLGMIKKTEIKDIFLALNILGITDLASVDPATVTVGDITDVNDQTNSAIVRSLLSKAIIDGLDPLNEGKIPTDAYEGDIRNKLLTAEEVDALMGALNVLSGNDPNVTILNINTNITVGQTQNLDTSATGSAIIKQFISDAVIDSLGSSRIPSNAYHLTQTDRLSDSEIGYMKQSLLPLSGNDPNILISNIIITEGTISVQTLKDFPSQSIILNRMISTAIIDGLGSNNIPDESFSELILKLDIKRVEIDALLEALDIMGIGTSGAGGIAMADVTFAELDLVVAIGTTDAINYPLGFSPIIVHVLSVPMTAAVTDIRGGFDYGIPSTAYRNTNDLKHEEIESLISALKTIGGIPPASTSTTLAAVVLGLDPTAFGPVLINALIAEDSLIVFRMISIGINDANIDNDDAYALLGQRNYDPVLNALATPAINDIKISEMSGLADSMTILGMSNVLAVASISISNVLTLTDLEIDQLFDNNNTIIYYIVNDMIQSDPGYVAMLAPTDIETTEPYRVKRASLITLLKNNN